MKPDLVLIVGLIAIVLTITYVFKIMDDANHKKPSKKRNKN